MRDPTLSHGRAAGLMLLVTLLWSTAGVVARLLQAAASFEVTFWRSAFTLLTLVVVLRAMRGPGLWRALAQAPRIVWFSGLCWAVMFTAFMLAITLTQVANVLVTMAIGPLLTALFARVFLHHRLPLRTWLAISVAGAGIAWMFAHGVQAADAQSALGMAVAVAVPLAAAANWTLLHRAGQQSTAPGPDDDVDVPPVRHDMLPAVLIGAVISTAVTLPLAWPFHATAHDLGWLALLGVFQLGLPCLLVVRLARALPSHEISLLGLLEVLFGVLWAFLGAGEVPSASTLAGGMLVIGALLFNEWLNWRAQLQLAAALPASPEARP